MAYTTINKGTDNFNTATWTGNNTARSITGVGFQPDLTWLKSRTQTYNHILTDGVRGVTKYVSSNTSTAETTDAATLTAFNSDGFSLGTSNLINQTSQNHVAWNWKAGGSASSNTNGSINSSVSANTTNGFSIVKYTGNSTDNASVGHGLNTAPKVVMIKELDSTSNWGVWHQGLTNGGYRLSLQETTAQVSDTAFIGGGNRAIPTTSVFYLGSGGGGNSSSNSYIAYCFSDITGFSKMGSYAGNGNANGTFVYTGFKPAFVMSKSYTNTESWIMKDVARDTFNPVEKNLAANSASSEAGWGTSYDIDILSNGFKMRDASGQTNGNGYGFIYMAFAEAPLVGTNGVTAKAR